MTTITPSDLARCLRENADALLLDVRTPAEFESVHVRGATSMPLHELDAGEVRRLARPGAPVFLICHSGQRATQAAKRLDEAGVADTRVVAGGTVAAEAAGLPVVRGRQTMSLMRQSLIGAGVVVWTGLLLAYFVSPWFLLLTALAGCGLIVAGAFDFCLMAMLLARMPWNRRSDAQRTVNVGPGSPLSS